MEQVVKVTDIGSGIIEVKMQDRNARNTFSKELIKGIIKAFKDITEDQSYKVIILTGYDNYFCCGGTQEELFEIYRKEIGFNDLDFFSLPLFCEIPVIAAMQGHGIGGGLVFGCYADFMILGKENVYTANFMKYGFTPGMGGTYVIPKKMGITLGEEMLYTASSYRGTELMKRGVQQTIVDKAIVMEKAKELALKLAEKPRISLVALKKQLTRDTRSRIPEVIAAELQMHEVTFHQKEVKEKIESLFGK